MIELRGVSKKFSKKGRSVTALDDISLFVPAGKIYGVIGSSGAGKSTLIRCVNLLEKPDAGEIIVNGKNIVALSSKELALSRRQIGMIFQHFNLLSSRTVFQNIAFPLELEGLDKSTIKNRVAELLDLVGLTEKQHDYPAALSGGQKQRVAIARTLASRPAVLLCDEATSALDPATTTSILALLKDINQKFNITILLITHEMQVVKSICDSVAIIDQGRLIEQGPVASVFAHPVTAVAKTFIASTLHVEIPALYQQRLKATNEAFSHPLLKLGISGQSLDEPVLSQAARKFNIDTKIISAQLQNAGDTSFGILIVELSGNRFDFQKVIDFFIERNISVETIGYV